MMPGWRVMEISLFWCASATDEPRTAAPATTIPNATHPLRCMPLPDGPRLGRPEERILAHAVAHTSLAPRAICGRKAVAFRPASLTPPAIRPSLDRGRIARLGAR